MCRLMVLVRFDVNSSLITKFNGGPYLIQCNFPHEIEVTYFDKLQLQVFTDSDIILSLQLQVFTDSDII